MGKPNYRVIVTFDRDRTIYAARCPELEHLSGEGASRAAAIAAIEVEIDAQLANMLSHGTTPPQAVDDTEFSGDIAAKVSRALHRDLMLMARSDGLELGQLVGELLSSALTARQGTRGGARSRTAPAEHSDDIGNRINHQGGGGGGGNGGGNGNRRFGRNFNPQLMDDRANFIEYVRGLEHGQSGPTHQRHSGPPQNHGGGGGGFGGGGGGGGRDQGRRRNRGGRGGNPNGGPGREGNRQQAHGQGPQPQHNAPRPAPSVAPPQSPPAQREPDSHES